MKELQVTAQTAGGRLDKMLLKYFDQTGAGFVYKMLRKKNILLNEKKASGNEILQDGDQIKLYLADETIRRFHSEKAGSGQIIRHTSLETLIIYEDENLLAVAKPAGILSQKSEIHEVSLNDMIRDYLGETSFFTPGIANRLDRNTTGLVLAGKNPAAQRCLSMAVNSRQLHKHYLCIVKGVVTRAQSLEGFLFKDPTRNKVKIYEKASAYPEQAQYIRTDYRVLSHGTESSLLEVDLITGRTHQIRAHLAFHQIPVIGDSKYGDRTVNAYYQKKYGVKNQLLHAYKIAFVQMTGLLTYLNGREITAPVPEDFRKVMEGDRLCLHGSQEG